MHSYKKSFLAHNHSPQSPQPKNPGYGSALDQFNVSLKINITYFIDFELVMELMSR
jgi:hypothetical protein